MIDQVPDLTSLWRLLSRVRLRVFFALSCWPKFPILGLSADPALVPRAALLIFVSLLKYRT